MFPFPQAPDGGNGGMTANQVQQPMAQPMQYGAQPQMPQGGMPQWGQSSMMPQGGNPGMQPPTIGQGIDPQQLAALRARLMQQQQMQPGNNLRALLGL